MGMRERGIALSLARLRKNAGYEYVYHKKDGTTIVLTNVLKGTKKWRFTDDNLVSQHVETTDFVFAVEQFTDFRRGTNEPFAGDLLKIAVTSEDMDCYEVVSVNKERVWRFPDADESTIRVHTIFLRREAK